MISPRRYMFLMAQFRASAQPLEPSIPTPILLRLLELSATPFPGVDKRLGVAGFDAVRDTGDAGHDGVFVSLALWAAVLSPVWLSLDRCASSVDLCMP